jgi:hypothetical protein
VASKTDSSQTITPQELAQILTRSDQELVRLTKLAVLVRTTAKRNGRQRIVYDKDYNVRRYIQHLLKRSEESKDDYQYEKRLTQQIVRETKEHELRVLRGDMIKRDRVVFVVTNLLSMTKNHMLGMPARCARRLVRQRDVNKVRTILDEDVRNCLREASRFGTHSFDETSKNGEHETDDSLSRCFRAKRF